MKSDNRKYYENFDWDSAELSKKLEPKIKLIMENIPGDVKNIIDIGCGDGTISNSLNKKFHVLAVDRSVNALKYLQTKKICASADGVPVKDRKFDLVFSSEMIEHLPDEIFELAINEFKRLSNKYIFLTFPNNENIEKNFVKCPNCNFVFNKVYHLRTLNLSIIKELFPEFEIVSYFDWGLRVRHYNLFLSKVKHKLVPSEAWIPLHWTKNNRKTECPNCEHSFEIPYKFNLLGFLIDSLNVLLSPKRPYQLFVILKRK